MSLELCAVAVTCLHVQSDKNRRLLRLSTQHFMIITKQSKRVALEIGAHYPNELLLLYHIRITRHTLGQKKSLQMTP